MRTIFFGTSDFAVPVLEALHGSGATIPLVVTTPSRPKGRGRHVEPTPIAACAERLGLAVFQPEKINAPEAREQLASGAADLFVVVAYGRILGTALLGMPRLGAVNLHGSLLPRLRGAAPIARAIEQGETSTGVSCQFMVREVDAGDVIGTKAVSILEDETHGELSSRMSRLAAELLLELLPVLERGEAKRTPQDPALATFAPPLRKEEGQVDWKLAALAIRNRVRALSPWPMAHTHVRLGDESVRLTLHRVRVLDDTAKASPGTIVRVGSTIDVAAGDRVVAIERLQRPGKREMSAEEFLRGTRIEKGITLE